jgi:DNA-binding NtrC family response regulator
VDIRVPNLSERKEDLPLLERHFVSKFAAQYGKEIRGLTHRARIVLTMHSWPGNIRELENVLGHACMMTMGDTIDVQDFPAYLHSHGGEERAEAASVEAPDGSMGTLEEQERILIVRALESCGGNQSQAARMLRIGRDALRYKLKKHNL